MRGGLLAVLELCCLAAAGSAAAAFMWSWLDPLGSTAPEPSQPASRHQPLLAPLPGQDPFFRGPTPLAGASTAPATQGFTLHATRVAGASSSAILSAAGLPQATYRIGDPVGDARLSEVLHDRVVLERGGQRLTVTFPNTPPSGLPSAVSSATQPALAIPGLSPAGPAGPAGGYRVDGSSSLLAAAGLEPGDIILAIDGRPLSAASLEGLQASLTSGAAAEIRFQRNGQTMTKRIGGSAQ